MTGSKVGFLLLSLTDRPRLGNWRNEPLLENYRLSDLIPADKFLQTVIIWFRGSKIFTAIAYIVMWKYEEGILEKGDIYFNSVVARYVDGFDGSFGRNLVTS